MFDDSPFNEQQTIVTNLAAHAEKRKLDFCFGYDGTVSIYQRRHQETASHKLIVEKIAGGEIWKVTTCDKYGSSELKHAGMNRAEATTVFLETAPSGWLS